jgi:phosphotransferase system enzyme I (PtsI)
MSPAALADVRTELAKFTLEQTQEFAEIALSANSAVEARVAVTAAANSLTTSTTLTESE